MGTWVNSVLIVDADKESRNTLSAHFEKLGWIVYTANDGRHATQVLQRNNPDIMLMDIVLPVRDGITTCSLIRKDVSMTRHFPIIMMTASPDRKQLVRAIDAGCDDFIVKPFKFDTLLSKMKELVDFQRKKEKEEENQDEEAVEKEAEIIVYSKQMVEKAFSNAMHGKLVDYPVIKKTTAKMVEIVHKEKTLPLAFKMRSYNDYTYIHSVNVAALCMSFAYHLDWNDLDLQIVGEGGFLHDIGKTQVDLKILLKPDKLTDDEFSEMKKHPEKGNLIASKQNIDPDILKVIFEHHERDDGKGYPNKLANGQISKYGKLSAIVDVYDALTTDRCYHKGIDSEVAIEKMSSWQGHFDPEYFENFSSLISAETIGK
ncbi:MAG TPA: response regulator [Nitrospinota bacterium]|nr:response regulator [Nitrospinota bacterium]